MLGGCITATLMRHPVTDLADTGTSLAQLLAMEPSPPDIRILMQVDWVNHGMILTHENSYGVKLASAATSQDITNEESTR